MLAGPEGSAGPDFYVWLLLYKGQYALTQYSFSAVQRLGGGQGL